MEIDIRKPKKITSLRFNGKYSEGVAELIRLPELVKDDTTISLDFPRISIESIPDLIKALQKVLELRGPNGTNWDRME